MTTQRTDKQSAGKQPGAKPQPSRRNVLKSAVVSAGVAAAALTPGTTVARQRIDRNFAAFIATTQTTQNTNLKRRARADYERSMARFGGRLANDPGQLFHTATLDPAGQFDVVVIGSGYGAAMIASRLAPRMSQGRRLAIIERGREWIPGEFPDNFSRLTDEARNQLYGPTRRSVTNPLGLHNVIMNDEVNVWTGNGLGGGSLINANVALMPDPEVFSKFKWPGELSDRGVLFPYYQAAAAGLNLARTPWDLTPKVRSRREAADTLHPYPGFFDLSPLTVMYDDRWLGPESMNPHGVVQRPCTLCGDCITGCNVGAKNTLTMNWLPVAKTHGAEIYTQTEVTSIEKIGGHYRLNLTYHYKDNCWLRTRTTCVWSRMVVVAAGSPGSPALLLKSRDQGLCLSPALGHRWSGNGDTLGFIVDKCGESQIGGVGANDKEACIGPTLQTSLSYSHRPQLKQRFLIQEAAIPRAATNLFRVLLRDGELDNSAVMLGMGHDGAIGRVELDQRGNPTIKWPGLKDAEFRRQMWAEFERIATAEGGRYKRLAAFGDNLVTVHPLGGCALADDPIDGVVNARGEVFDGAGSGYSDSRGAPAVHSGLYVADGSIIPSSLACNPLLTISALALRIADGILSNPEHREMFA